MVTYSLIFEIEKYNQSVFDHSVGFFR